MFKLFTQYRGLRKENYILFLGRIVTNLGSMVYPVLTLIMNQKLGYNATAVSLIMILSGLVQLPLGILGGKLADKHNKRNIIVIFDSISIIFYIICAFIPLSWMTILFLIIGSTFQSIEAPAYNALIADLTATKDRERAYSLSYLGANIGLVASPTIAGLLFKDYLWLSFLISGIAIATSTILIFCFIRDITPVDHSEDESSEYQVNAEGVSTISILKSNLLILVYIIAMAFYWSAYGQYGFLMPLDMARVHGDQGAVLYGSVSSLNCIVVVIFTPIITHLFAKMCATKKNLTGILMVAVGYIVFLLGLGHIPTYYIAIILFTWGEIFSTIVSGPYISERIPASHRGRINGALSVVQGFFSGICMYSIGLLYDYVGSLAAWIFIFAMLGIASIGAIIIIFWDRKKYPALYAKTNAIPPIE